MTRDGVMRAVSKLYAVLAGKEHIQSGTEVDDEGFWYTDISADHGPMFKVSGFETAEESEFALLAALQAVHANRLSKRRG